MKKRNNARRNVRGKNQKHGALPWRAIALTFSCGCILVAGIFFAANQHFSSITYGMQNSELRKKLEDLEAENRRLLLAKEVAMAPSQIKAAAETFGFRAVSISDIPLIAKKDPSTELVKPAEIRSETDNGTPVKVIAAKKDEPEAKNAKAAKPVKPVEATVVRTTMTIRSPAKQPSRSEKPGKPTKPTVNIDERPRMVAVAKLR